MIELQKENEMDTDRIELATATDWGILENSPESMDLQLSKLQKAGIRYIHWSYDWDFEFMYTRPEMLQIKYLLHKYGMKIKGVHATEGNTRCRIVNGQPVFLNRRRMRDNRKDITSPHEFNRLAGIELVKNRVDLANFLGATEMVLHLVVPYEDFEESPEAKELWYSQVFRSFDELQPYCRINGVRICIENIICTPLKYQIEEFDRLFERYDKDYMGICVDTGHENLVCKEQEQGFLERYYSRLYAMHLDDNRGVDQKLSSDADGAVQKSDVHILPFTGTVNWDKVCRFIAKSSYELPLTLEVTVPHKTEEEEWKGLMQLKEAGIKLTNMVLGYRKEYSK
jgi:sugar phosphate isomerase/epimerase